MAKATHGDFLRACDEILVAAKTNAEEPGVENLRLELEKDREGIKEARARRNVHRAAAQQASRDFDARMESAKKIYSRLRHMLIALFGLSSEKLAEFGLQPFRPQPESTGSKVKRFLEKEKPPENGHEPTQAARPQTDFTN